MVVAHKGVNCLDLIEIFFVGGIGPGSYYFPIMIQTVIIIPIIWFIIKKYYLKGLMICFVANIVYECLKTTMGMGPALYRILVFRYIFILAFGCYLFVKQSEKREEKMTWYIIAGITGVAYIVAFMFCGLVPIITNQWIGTSVFAVLYIVPVMLGLMKPNKVHNQVIELLGKASFNIFLTQMVFYWAVGSIIDRYIPGVVLQVLANIVICCILGVVFYKIESPITQRMVKVIRGGNTTHH